MAEGTKNYMWFPVIIALSYTLYANDVYRDIAYKAITGDISKAYEAYLKYANSEMENVETSENLKIFSVQELETFSDLEKGLYLAILGRVYDVSEGEKHYGAGGGYHGFIGKDATSAFVTGKFDDGNDTDDVSTLTNSQAKSIIGWINFYDEKYVFKGKLVGRFYDENGDPTAEYHEFMKKVDEADADDAVQEDMKRKFPPCNVEWKPEEGTRVWCSPQSGGISREWTGVPRLLFEDSSSPKNRCACVNLQSSDFHDNHKKFREYENCAVDSSTCYVKT